MPRNLIFYVTDDSWAEHNSVGIAAINDPGFGEGSQANAGRQKAIAEIAGIMPGDRILFRVGRSNEHSTQIAGLFRATSEPYFDQSPLFPGATTVGAWLALRVEFECDKPFLNPVDIEHLWLSKEKGVLWSIQQSRGDVMGRHACTSISDEEADLIIRLLEANNPVEGDPIDYMANRAAVGLGPINKSPLPVDLQENSPVRNPTPGRFHYEAALQTVLMEDLVNGLHRDVLGEFTEAMPFVSTGAQTELDLLLIKRRDTALLWYQILELKAKTFSEDELRKVIDYEKWILNTRCENVLQAHSVGIGYEFDDEVLEFVRGRRRYKDRPIRLLQYRFDAPARQLTLTPVD